MSDVRPNIGKRVRSRLQSCPFSSSRTKIRRILKYLTSNRFEYMFPIKISIILTSRFWSNSRQFLVFLVQKWRFHPPFPRKHDFLGIQSKGPISIDSYWHGYTKLPSKTVRNDSAGNKTHGELIFDSFIPKSVQNVQINICPNQRSKSDLFRVGFGDSRNFMKFWI